MFVWFTDCCCFLVGTLLGFLSGIMEGLMCCMIWGFSFINVYVVGLNLAGIPLEPKVPVKSLFCKWLVVGLNGDINCALCWDGVLTSWAEDFLFGEIEVAALAFPLLLDARVVDPNCMWGSGVVLPPPTTVWFEGGKLPLCMTEDPFPVTPII